MRTIITQFSDVKPKQFIRLNRHDGAARALIVLSKSHKTVTVARVGDAASTMQLSADVFPLPVIAE